MLFVVAVFEITVTGDVKGVSSMDRQIRFASAKSINDTGKFARSETVRELDDEFEIRGNWMKEKTRFGINFTNAKFSAPIPEGVLFTRADWLLEAEGYNRGVKRAEDGSRLADPEDENTRGEISRKFPVAQKAGRLLANSRGRISPKSGKLIGATGAYIVQPKGKPGIQYVFQRVGTKDGEIRRNKKGVPLRGRLGRGGSKSILKHVLKKSVKVDRPMIIQKTGINTFRVWYPEYLGRNLLLAFRTAK